jgi:hypothetical protein
LPCGAEENLERAHALHATQIREGHARHFIMTREEYLQVLEGFEARLRRHADAWGHLLPDPQVQALRNAWETMAASFIEEHPQVDRPVPFWEKAGYFGSET